MIYFIRAGGAGPIKIGVTTNVAKRMASLQTASPKLLPARSAADLLDHEQTPGRTTATGVQTHEGDTS